MKNINFEYKLCESLYIYVCIYITIWRNEWLKYSTKCGIGFPSSSNLSTLDVAQVDPGNWFRMNEEDPLKWIAL